MIRDNNKLSSFGHSDGRQGQDKYPNNWDSEQLEYSKKKEKKYNIGD